MQVSVAGSSWAMMLQEVVDDVKDGQSCKRKLKRESF